MIKQNNAMTFTKRLNYSVSEVPKEEFLAVLSEYGQNEKNKENAENIQNKFQHTNIRKI